MKSLFAKLSFALFLVMTLLGSGFFLIERYSTQNYYEEITQRLNASIAMYVTGEMQLMEGGEVNEEALSLLALLTVAVTLVFGRVFCGWFCPFGTLHNAVASVRRQFRRVVKRTEQFSRWQRAKYFVFIALLVMTALGAQFIQASQANSGRRVSSLAIRP